MVQYGNRGGGKVGIDGAVATVQLSYSTSRQTYLAQFIHLITSDTPLFRVCSKILLYRRGQTGSLRSFFGLER